MCHGEREVKVSREVSWCPKNVRACQLQAREVSSQVEAELENLKDEHDNRVKIEKENSDRKTTLEKEVVNHKHVAIDQLENLNKLIREKDKEKNS